MATAHLSRQKSSHLSPPSPSPRRKTPTIQTCLESWLSDNKAQGFSPKTIRERRGFIERIIWWYQNEEGVEVPQISEIDTPTIRRFLSYLRDPHEEGRFGSKHPCSKAPAKQSTVFAYHREISAFCRWLVEEQYFEEFPLANLKRPKVAPHLIEPFTEAQVKALIAATSQSVAPLRNKIIIFLLAETGLRVSELCSLTIKDVGHEEITVLGKGNKKRQVFIGKMTRRLLRQYINTERSGAELDEALFVADGGNKKGEYLRPNGVRIILRRLGKVAGIDSVRCSPHTFRHFFAVTCLRSGMSGYQLMRLLGHTDLEMTKRYLNLTQEDLKAAHAVASPMDKLMK